MALNSMSPDKLSLKNLLFCKAIPNYVIPVPTEGRLVHACKDCGDKFMFQSSYDYHINRKSVQITYMCRICNQIKIFFNRCNLLSHIRSHAFKTATINVSDLRIDPLPLSVFNYQSFVQKSNQLDSKRARIRILCFDCKQDIQKTGIGHKDREEHYREHSTEIYTCPICLFAMKTPCSLKTHLRIHLKQQPLFCPECGISLSTKNIKYPYHHDCEGFKMMRATARTTCPKGNCGFFQPSDLYDHFKRQHCKKIFRCVSCSVASYSEISIMKHVKMEHSLSVKIVLSFQCDLCPASLIPIKGLKKHVSNHSTEAFVFPCWTCGKVFTVASSLVSHHNKYHSPNNELMKNTFCSESNGSSSVLRQDKSDLMCRVVKKCDNCSRCFTYKCKYDQIAILPNECPYQCSDNPDTIATTTEEKITCCFCKISLSCNWNVIKKHFAQHHKGHKCLDIQIVIPRVIAIPTVSSKKVKKTRAKRKRMVEKRKGLKIISHTINSSCTPKPSRQSLSKDELQCKKCIFRTDSKEDLEAHLICHRDPYMAYQCMECGESFVGKPSFSTHLLVDHSVSNIDDYIIRKKCFNETALKKYQDQIPTVYKPLRENQCTICRQQFDDAEDLEKHFRVHGMAFLLKTSSKNGPVNP